MVVNDRQDLAQAEVGQIPARIASSNASLAANNT